MTKGISTGAMFLCAWLWLTGDRSPLVTLAGPVVSLIFAMLTAVVLVIDLERPERFLYILTRPNWKSWLARGAFILTAHGGLVSLWILFALLGWTDAMTFLAPAVILVAVAATGYTGLLFAQGLARDLWQGSHQTLDLLAQAAAEGSAALLLTAVLVGIEPAVLRALGWTLLFSTLTHLVILTLEHFAAPSPTLHHELAVRAIRYGPYKRLFWLGALGLGGFAPVLIAGAAANVDFPLFLLVPASVVALAGSLAWEYIWVDAGQAVPIS
jgi:formate-dependent nitrite reductase membrane component NrfD